MLLHTRISSLDVLTYLLILYNGIPFWVSIFLMRKCRHSSWRMWIILMCVIKCDKYVGETTPMCFLSEWESHAKWYICLSETHSPINRVVCIKGGNVFMMVRVKERRLVLGSWLLFQVTPRDLSFTEMNKVAKQSSLAFHKSFSRSRPTYSPGKCTQEAPSSIHWLPDPTGSCPHEWDDWGRFFYPAALPEEGTRMRAAWAMRAEDTQCATPRGTL